MKEIQRVLEELHARPVAFFPIYKILTNSVHGGILISQLMFWHNTVNRKFWKTDKELRNELYMTERELKTAKEKIKNIPFIKITREGIPCKTFYEINMDLYEVTMKKAVIELDGIKHNNIVNTSQDGSVLTSRDGSVLTTTKTTTKNTNKEKNEEKKVSGKPSHSVSSVTPKMIYNNWNKLASKTELSRVIKFTDKIKKNLNARIKTYPSIKFWKEVFKKLYSLKHLHSKESDWRFDFFWLIRNDESINKLMSGKYDIPWKDKNKSNELILPNKNDYGYDTIYNPIYDEERNKIINFVKHSMPFSTDFDKEVRALHYALFKEVNKNWSEEAKRVIADQCSIIESIVSGGLERFKNWKGKNFKMFYPPDGVIWKDYISEVQKINDIDVHAKGELYN